jgi:hypothetical protein
VLAVLLVLLSTPALAAERYAVIVSGASGGEVFAALMQKWRGDLAMILKSRFSFAEANVMVLDEDATGNLLATSENVRSVFTGLRSRMTPDDMLLVVLLGHGTFDGIDAKFNLVGPDFSASDWRGLLGGLPGRTIVVNTTETSFPFVQELSIRGRIVITATDSIQQRFATVFPEFFITALADPAIDVDKDGRVSIWEAFAAGSAKVKQYYEQGGRLASERPLLDDNGDAEGREAETPGADGELARTTFFDPPVAASSENPATAVLERQRLELERKLEALKQRRSTMSEAEYQAELERILVELAKITQQIRQGP